MRLILFALATTAVIATPAMAGLRSMTFAVTPADFASPAARAELDRRIAAAVEHVCGSYAAIEGYQWPEMNACWRAARAQINDSLGRVDSSTLASMGK